MDTFVIADVNQLTFYALQQIVRHKRIKMYFASTMTELQQFMKSYKEAVLILTQKMIEFESTTHLENLVAAHKVVVITDKKEQHFLYRWKKAGVKSFLHTGNFKKEAIKAIANLNAEGTFLSSNLMNVFDDLTGITSALFTPTETYLYKYVVEGYSLKEIVALTGMKPSTAETHCRNMNKKVHDEGYKNVVDYAFCKGHIVWNGETAAQLTNASKVVIKHAMPPEPERKERDVKQKTIGSGKAKAEGAIARKRRLTVELYEDGMETDGIANQLMISETVVKKYLIDNGLLVGSKGFSAPNLANEDW